jgi:hypothetical protein
VAHAQAAACRQMSCSSLIKLCWHHVGVQQGIADADLAVINMPGTDLIKINCLARKAKQSKNNNNQPLIFLLLLPPLQLICQRLHWHQHLRLHLGGLVLGRLVSVGLLQVRRGAGAQRTLPAATSAAHVRICDGPHLAGRHLKHSSTSS